MRHLEQFLCISALTFSCVCAGHTQMQWAPPGATWHYLFGSFWEGGGYESMYHLKDTMIQGRTCSILAREIVYINYESFDTIQISLPNQVVHQSGDTLFQYTDSFEQLYNMDLAVGDTVTFMQFPGMERNYNIVDQVNTMTINGQELKFQRIAIYWDDEFLFHIRILEKIGVLDYPFSFFWNETTPTIADLWEFLFNCYSDSELGDVHLLSLPCEDLPVLSAVSSVSADSEIFVYPNPASGELHIESKELLKKICLYDLHGRLLKHILPDRRDLHIETDHIEPGTYFIQAVSNTAVYCQTVMIGRQ